MGIRFSKKSQIKLILKFKSQGAILKDYIIVPEELLAELSRLSKYVKESFENVNSLSIK